MLLDFLPLIFYRGELEVWLTAPTIAAGQRGIRHVINEVWSFAVDFPCLRFVIFYFSVSHTICCFSLSRTCVNLQRLSYFRLETTERLLIDVVLLPKMVLKYASFEYGILFDDPDTNCTALENPDIAGVGVCIHGTE